jgi:hypothetical protein
MGCLLRIVIGISPKLAGSWQATASSMRHGFLGFIQKNYPFDRLFLD